MKGAEAAGPFGPFGRRAQAHRLSLALAVGPRGRPKHEPLVTPVFPLDSAILFLTPKVLDTSSPRDRACSEAAEQQGSAWHDHSAGHFPIGGQKPGRSGLQPPPRMALAPKPA